MNPNSNPQSLSRTKKVIFSLITFLIPVLLFIFVEAGLRMADYGGNTHLFISTPDEQSPYWGINPDVMNRYFYRDTFRPTPRKDVFLKHKPENGLRIFVLGGSTTAGFPYGNNLTFPRILHRRLVHAFPEKHVEVVNCAFTAINSYTLLDVMDEILQHKPDLLLIYAGHNEFYGALGVSSMEFVGRQRWFAKSYLKLQKLKIFLWMRNSISTIRTALSSQNIAGDPTRTVMSRMVKDQTIPLYSPLYRKGLQQFRSNIQDILTKAADAKVPVIISELVSNIRDHQPFVSVQTDSFPADIVFNLGRTAEAQGNFLDAKIYYQQAKDLDALRFRASEDMNAILHDLAQHYDVPVVPMKKYFEQASPNQLIGNTLMWEHLHPNRDGYFLMANAFFETLPQAPVPVLEWGNIDISADERLQKNWGFTPLDSLYAAFSIQQLKGSWPFVPQGMPNQFMTQFQPRSRQEQIVFDILVNGSLTLEEGHLTLAAEFEKNQQFERALQEYRALVYTVPYLDVFYQPMIRMLVQQEKYETAIAELQQALHFQNSAFVHKWLGQLLLAQGQSAGIKHLQIALDQSAQDAQILYNLARALYGLGRFTEGDSYLDQLHSLVQDKAEIQSLLEFRRLMIQKYTDQNVAASSQNEPIRFR